MIYEITEFGIRLTIKVTPKASSNKIVANDELLRVYVTTVPEDGKANKAVIAILAKALGVAKSHIQILQGDTARLKTLLISGDREHVQRQIEGLLPEH